VSHDPSEIALICLFGAQFLLITIGAQLLIMVLLIINIENVFAAETVK